MIRFENEIVYFCGFKHITVNRKTGHVCDLCKIKNYGICCKIDLCIRRFTFVGLRTLNI